MGASYSPNRRKYQRLGLKTPNALMIYNEIKNPLITVIDEDGMIESFSDKSEASIGHTLEDQGNFILDPNDRIPSRRMSTNKNIIPRRDRSFTNLSSSSGNPPGIQPKGTVILRHSIDNKAMELYETTSNEKNTQNKDLDYQRFEKARNWKYYKPKENLKEVLDIVNGTRIRKMVEKLKSTKFVKKSNQKIGSKISLPRDNRSIQSFLKIEEIKEEELKDNLSMQSN